MKKTRWIKIFKKLHKWPAILISTIAMLFAVSGIIMNHRQLVSPVDVSRKILPENYSYENWNLAAVRGSVDIDEGKSLLYGNIGVWSTDDNFKTFSDFNQGFPGGIDNRKIYSVVKHKKFLFAGTQFGMYRRSISKGKWEKIEIPANEDRIADMGLKNDTLLVLTRHYLLTSTDGLKFELIPLPAPAGYKRKTGLFNTFWELHSGELFGLPGKLAVDLLGLVTIFLSITGLIHFFLPKVIKRRKKREKQVDRHIGSKKKNLRWHNVVGYIFVLFLLINTFSGMHLRPPLLIPIANKEVGIIPKTHMDTPNPWHDKLRRVLWDANSEQYIFSTSKGMFFAEKTLTHELKSAPSQPPVSVMGCNVFDHVGNNTYLIGSFSGLYFWNINTGQVADFFSQQPYIAPQGVARPISPYMVAGLVKTEKGAFWFDFNDGAKRVGPNREKFTFPNMSKEIIENSPMSLWNVSLEIHTGRIFEHLLGAFYILYVPLAGMCIILVLVSGFLIWWIVYRKR